MITDEMVEKAREAYDDSYPESRRTAMRAALEAVAPLITVQIMREVIAAIDASEGDIDFAKFKLRGRIQELDPK